MPPRYNKRRAGFQLRRSGFKRRRVSFRSRRPFYISSVKHSRRPRVSRFRKNSRRSRFRRFSRMRRYGKRRSFGRRVVNSLAPPKTFVTEYGQEHTVPAATASDGQQCVYFTVEAYNNTATVDNVQTIELMHQVHLMRIADYYRNGNLSTGSYFNAAALGGGYILDPRFKYLLKSGVQISRLRNQSNEPVSITAYFCRPRGNMTEGINSGVQNLYAFLASGFANSGLDSAHLTASTNIYMHKSRYSPFRSFDFARSFKITSVKKLLIHPGMMRSVKLRVRSQMVRPIDWVLASGTAVPASGSWTDLQPKFNYFKQQRFVLFKLTSQPAGFGATQATYSKLIQTTTPTVLLSTYYKYVTKAVPYWNSNPVDLFDPVGYTTSGAAGHNPGIIVPDGDVVGEEKEAP